MLGGRVCPQERLGAAPQFRPWGWGGGQLSPRLDLEGPCHPQIQALPPRGHDVALPPSVFWGVAGFSAPRITRGAPAGVWGAGRGLTVPLRHLSLPQRWPCRWNAPTLTYPRTCPPATSAASAVPCPPSHCPPAPRPPPSSGR